MERIAQLISFLAALAALRDSGYACNPQIVTTLQAIMKELKL